jgi:hypothetical protein
VLRLVDSRVQLAVTDGLATLRDFNMESRCGFVSFLFVFFCFIIFIISFSLLSYTESSNESGADEYVIEDSNSDDGMLELL